MTAVICLVIFYPLCALGAQVTSVDLPAGNFARAGDYFPLVLTVEGAELSSDSVIMVTAGKQSFSMKVKTRPGASSKVLINILAAEEHPNITIELKENGQRWRYPQLERSLADRLVVIPRTEHLVAILSGADRRALVWLFQQRGITAVSLSTALEYPGEVLGFFDLVAFDGSLWNSMNLEVRKSLEDYVRSGGRIFISEPDEVPEAILRSTWGLGELVVMTNEEHDALRKTSSADAAKRRILDKMGLLTPYDDSKLDTMEMSELFGPLPRFGNLRNDWLIFAIVSFLVLFSVGLCGMLRVWRMQTHKYVVTSLVVILSAGFFSVTVPDGNVAHEIVSVVQSTSNSDMAIRDGYVHLYAFSSSEGRAFPLGSGGFVYPLRQMWSSYGDGNDLDAGLEKNLISNGENASVRGGGIDKEKSRFFRVTGLCKMDGGIDSRAKAGKHIVVNNTGIDMVHCAFLMSGRIVEIGDMPFGKRIEVGLEKGIYLQDYIGRIFDAESREGRIIGDFMRICLKKLTRPNMKYLVGWSKDSEVETGGYAQSDSLGSLWIVEIR